MTLTLKIFNVHLFKSLRKCLKKYNHTLCHPFSGHFRFLCKYPLYLAGFFSHFCPSFNPSMISHSELRRWFFLRAGGFGGGCTTCCWCWWCNSVVLSALKLFVSTLASESLVLTTTATLLPFIFIFTELFFLSMTVAARCWSWWRRSFSSTSSWSSGRVVGEYFPLLFLLLLDVVYVGVLYCHGVLIFLLLYPKITE